MKETGFSHWAEPNYGATNLFGLTALPGGNCNGGGYTNLTYLVFFWSASEYTNPAYALERRIYWLYSSLDPLKAEKAQAFSVLCIKN